MEKFSHDSNGYARKEWDHEVQISRWAAGIRGKKINSTKNGHFSIAYVNGYCLNHRSYGKMILQFPVRTKKKVRMNP